MLCRQVSQQQTKALGLGSSRDSLHQTGPFDRVFFSNAQYLSTLFTAQGNHTLLHSTRSYLLLCSVNGRLCYFSLWKTQQFFRERKVLLQLQNLSTQCTANAEQGSFSPGSIHTWLSNKCYFNEAGQMNLLRKFMPTPRQPDIPST